MVALCKAHVPHHRLVDKHTVWWMRATGRALQPVNPRFMSHFTVVIGPTVYLPGPVDAQPPRRLAATLAHELVHQIDQRDWGPSFYVSYGVVGLAGRTARAMWERRAYAVDLMLAHHEAGEPGMQGCLDRLVPIFSGPAYLWMWAPSGSARAFLQPVVDEIRAGTLQTRFPYAQILGAWTG